ncbi:MAG: septation protein SpoVG family protein [Acidimicrobiales bacterium]
MEGPKDGLPDAAQEEWAVVIVEGRALDVVATSATGTPVLSEVPRRMVGICEVGQAGLPLTICNDEAEAYRISEAVGEQLQLPLYDGADAYAVQVDPGEYVDLEADGPDPYSQYRAEFHTESAHVAPSRTGVRPRGHVSQATDRTEASEEKEAHGPMKIEARNFKLLGDRTDNLLAVCDLNLGGEFVVQGVRVLKSSKDGKAFVSLPSYQDKNGDYHEVAHPVTAKAREVTNQVVLKEFERQVLAQLPKAADGPER